LEAEHTKIQRTDTIHHIYRVTERNETKFRAQTFHGTETICPGD